MEVGKKLQDRPFIGSLYLLIQLFRG